MHLYRFILWLKVFEKQNISSCKKQNNKIRMALLIHRPSSAASVWPPHTHTLGRAQSSTHSSTVTHSTARRLHVHARTLVGPHYVRPPCLLRSMGSSIIPLVFILCRSKQSVVERGETVRKTLLIIWIGARAAALYSTLWVCVCVCLCEVMAHLMFLLHSLAS